MSLKFWQIKLFIILGVIALGTGIALTKMFISFNNLSDLQQSNEYSRYAVPSKVYDIKGRLVAEYYKEKRNLVSFNDLPQNLIRAIIATEDNSFYEHNGANFAAMFQAVVLDPLRGRGIRGGSGITQQLAKLMFTDSAFSVQRKLIELWYAFQLEKKYSKEEILELYFNLIYFGHGQYGIQAASEFYFQKNTKDLSLGEASFLAGLPQAPSRYSPIINYKGAQARHRIVLEAMAKEAFISKKSADDTFQEFWYNYDDTFIAATQNIKKESDTLAPFFVEYVRQQAIKTYGEEQLYAGGLEIHTTLNLDYQRIANEEFLKTLSNEQSLYSSSYNQHAERLQTSYSDMIDLLGLSMGLEGITFGETRVKKLVKDTIVADQDMLSLVTSMLGIDKASKEIEKMYNVEHLVNRKTDTIQGALISINPNNGYIQAMIGGSEFNVANQFNRSTQAQRQVGSTFKSFLYAIALDNKIITPSEIFVDEIISYQLPNGGSWTPRNYNGSYLGAMTARRALTLSVNIITIKIWERMLKQVGYSRIIERLSLFFGEQNNDTFKRRIPNEMATALGTGTVSPLSLAQGYSVFINGGKTVKPISILKVYDRYGKLLDDYQTAHLATPQEQIISKETSLLMQSMLNDIVRKGTGAGAASRTQYKYLSSTGGKTGTSANWTDAWFAGFTPNSTTVTWVGLDSSSKSLGRGRSSALVVAPSWFSYMNRIGDLDKPSILPFTEDRSSLQAAFVSPHTGLLTTAADNFGYTEYFLVGTTPQTYGNPADIALMQAKLSQENEYTVTGQSIDLTVQELGVLGSDPFINNNDPYLLDNNLSDDLDLSFDLTSGL
ncbi:MAG: penicillin-binding protein 1A [Brevinema sp.]